MVEKIIKSISKAIFNEFGEGFTIYTEAVEQGLTEPCFFVTLLRSGQRRMMGKRFFCSHEFCVQFICGSKNKKEKNMNAASRLWDCLEFIKVDGDLMEGTRMNYTINDGVLNFYVNYNMFTYKQQEPVPIMEEMDYTGKI